MVLSPQVAFALLLLNDDRHIVSGRCRIWHKWASPELLPSEQTELRYGLAVPELPELRCGLAELSLLRWEGAERSAWLREVHCPG